jgi:hypothetical protein
MDIATLIGLLLGFGGLIGGFLWEGGTMGMLMVKNGRRNRIWRYLRSSYIKFYNG